MGTNRLIDQHGRVINYLRLSVIDRCNLRCIYCMPAEGIGKVCHSDILSYEELFRVARAAVAIGIEKIRVTGGEPLIRKGIIDFLGRLAAIPGLRQLVVTTNGVLLGELAADLRAAGVQRLNISLDSLDAATFARISRCGDLSRVLAGIAAAERCGFPVKLNMVVMRGVNDHELLDFAALSRERPITVRFIEYMPTIREPGWQKMIVPGDEILARLAERFTLQPLAASALAGPSRNFRIAGAEGALGVITPVSRHFCGECNRIRVTSTGKAKSCLFSDSETDLKPYFVSHDDALLTEALLTIVGAKPDSHRLSLAGSGHRSFAMAAIGG